MAHHEDEIRKRQIAEAQRRAIDNDYSEWKRMQASQSEQGRLAGSAQAGFLGGYGLGNNPQDMPKQEAAPQEEREIHRATRELDCALERLAVAVGDLDHRTAEVQRPDCPLPGAECVLPRSLPSAVVAQSIALAAITILDQVDKLEAMNRRIQL